MWFMAVYSKAWLLLWNTGSSLSLREEDSSLRSGSTRLRQLLHGRGSISHRFTMPTDHSRTDLRSEEHTSELQSRLHLVCRLLLEKKNEETDDTRAASNYAHNW